MTFTQAVRSRWSGALIAAACLPAPPRVTPSGATELVDYVKPLIGTNSQQFTGGNPSYGNLKPYVTAPMPLVLLRPQQQANYSANPAGPYYLFSNLDLYSAPDGICPDQNVRPLTGFRFSHQPCPHGGLGDDGFFSLMPLPRFL